MWKILTRQAKTNLIFVISAENMTRNSVQFIVSKIHADRCYLQNAEKWCILNIRIVFLRERRFNSAEEVMTATREVYGTILATCFSGASTSCTNVNRCSLSSGQRRDMDVFKCTPCYAASCETSMVRVCAYSPGVSLKTWMTSNITDTIPCLSLL